MNLRLNLAGVLITGLCLVGGCNSSFPDALRDTDGNILRAELLQDIRNNPDLTDEEKTQIFNDLGLTNPDVIDFLLNS